MSLGIRQSGPRCQIFREILRNASSLEPGDMEAPNLLETELDAALPLATWRPGAGALGSRSLPGYLAELCSTGTQNFERFLSYQIVIPLILLWESQFFLPT